jgi:hypothetical protein
LAFIATLMNNKIDFVVVDNPTVTKFTIHILAAVCRARARRNLGSHQGCARRGEGKRQEARQLQRIAVAKQRATAKRAEAVRGVITSTAMLPPRN